MLLNLFKVSTDVGFRVLGSAVNTFDPTNQDEYRSIKEKVNTRMEKEKQVRLALDKRATTAMLLEAGVKESDITGYTTASPSCKSELWESFGSIFQVINFKYKGMCIHTANHSIKGYPSISGEISRECKNDRERSVFKGGMTIKDREEKFLWVRFSLNGKPEKVIPKLLILAEENSEENRQRRADSTLKSKVMVFWKKIWS